MVMREECQKMKDEMVNSKSSENMKEDVTTVADDYNTAECSPETADELSDISSANNSSSGKITPRERRKIDRFRFQTQVINPGLTDAAQQSNNSNSKQNEVSAKQNFLRKRIQNRDRFKTRTLDETQVSPEILSSGSSPNDLHYFVQKEANLVLKSLKETKHADELLECETLSLVSNDDESENNSGSSINYRTYHKSWGLKANCIPIIQPSSVKQQKSVQNIDSEEETSAEEVKPVGKPKIVKPSPKVLVQVENEPDEEQVQGKGIRGRRKPLYSKSNLNNRSIPRSTKPIKNMTSELVKNVTSSFKSGTNLKNVMRKPVIQPKIVPTAKPPSGYVKSNPKQSLNNSVLTPKSGSPIRSAKSSPKHSMNNLVNNRQKISVKMPPLERQGTFTKDDTPKSKIPTTISSQNSKTPPSRIAKPVTPKIAPKPTSFVRNIVEKSASSDRAVKTPNSPGRSYNRSTSADSRVSTPRRGVQSSPSTQSLKSEVIKTQNGAIKRSSVGPRSNSSSSIGSTESGAKKQITSKIASLWKKIEQSKKQLPKTDTRIWIQPEAKADAKPTVNRSNTFEKEKETVLLRKKEQSETDGTKRVSRLGSFIIMDEGEGCRSVQYSECSAVVTPEVTI